jgi:heptosyltransferase-1
MSSVLVVRPSSLGDVVHALSIASDIAGARPGTAIDWVVEEAFADLPRISPLIRRAIPVALRRWRRSPFDASNWGEARAFRRALAAERYDHVLDLQEQVKGAVLARLARGTRHGFDRASVREPLSTLLHQAHHRVPVDAHFLVKCRMLAAAALGYELRGPPRWSFAPPAQVDAMPACRYAVALHVTSRDDKRWPDAHWRALLGQLAGSGFAVLLPWGNESERERSAQLAHGIDGAVVPPRQSLAALASLLARADLAVGVDTGLTHLAAALGTPTVSLFTTTDARLAGVAIAGPHAIDLGGNGLVPSVADAQAACGTVLRSLPRC